MSKVNNLKEFLEARGCGEVSVAQVKRSTYKYTSCGAWLETDKEGVSVGSIVEGVDQGTETYQLNYPFEIKDFWNSLDAVEQEAKEIWNSTHGCEDVIQRWIQSKVTQQSIPSAKPVRERGS